MIVDILPTDSGFRISSKVIGALIPETIEYPGDDYKLAHLFARRTWPCQTRDDVIALAKEFVALNFVE